MIIKIIFKSKISFSCIHFFLLGLLLNAQDSSKDSLIQQIQTIRNKGEQEIKSNTYVDLLTELAVKYRYRNADSILLLADEALKLSNKINYTDGKAFSLLRKADYYSDTGKEEKANELYKRSKKLAAASHNPILRVEILKSIATHEFVSQNLENTVKASYEGIEIASDNKLFELESKLRHNLGYCYSSYKLYDEALVEYLIADSLWTLAKGNSYQRATTLSNIALNAIEKGDLNLGKSYSEESIAILEQQNEPLWLSRVYRTKCRYYIKKQNYEKALNWIKKSDSALSMIYNPRDQMEIDLTRSTILNNLNKHSEAKKYALITLEAALSFKDSLTQAKSYDILEKIEGQTKNAYAYHQKSEKIRSLLNENGKVQNLALLRAKMDFAKEKEKLNLKNLRNTLTQQKHFQWITAALLTTIIIALIVYKSNRREKLLNKQLEEKTKILSESQIILNQINNNQDKLFSIVGHDLRGPIVSLRELVDFTLENKSGKEYFTRFAPKLRKDLDHIHFTLDNLLSWGQSQMKGATIRKETLNLVEEFKTIHQFCQKTLDQKSITLKQELSENLEVSCDRNHFNIVFRNLICNATKFSKENGTVIISAVKKEGNVVISIRDNGIGMSQEVLNKVFNSSEHYSTFGTNNERGTGLGIKLCKEMLKRNNGSICPESKVNSGTIIYVALPIATRQQSA